MPGSEVSTRFCLCPKTVYYLVIKKNIFKKGECGVLTA